MSIKGSLLVSKKKKPSFVKTPVGAVFTLLLVEAAAYGIWSYLGPAAEEAISLEQYTQLQGELTAGQGAVQKLRDELKTNEAHTKELQKKNQMLTRDLGAAIQLDGLPQEVKGKNPSETIKNIMTLYRESQDVNRQNVGALLAVFREIQEQGVINASLEAQEAARQDLYQNIQVVLNAIESFPGPITSGQSETLQAVIDFQAQNRLKVDGKIGLKTFMTIAELFEVKRLGLDADKKQAQQVSPINLRNSMSLSMVDTKG